MPYKEQRFPPLVLRSNKMKENIIRYNIYATYDRIANTLGLPFISQNNSTALRILENTKKKLKEEGLEVTDDISVMYLGQYIMTPIKNKNKMGDTISFEPMFSDTNNAYDVLNCFENSRERETGENETTNITNNVWEDEE